MDTAARSIDEKLSLVRKLADDLSKGDIELPSFPDVVMRIRQALEDENNSTDDIVRLIGAEPVLAARLISIANSAALRPSGDPITDLNTTVNRLGRVMVRTSAMSFAMAQMREAKTLSEVKVHLDALWQQCAHVAALCYVLAKKYTRLNADEAMFVGLVHCIGQMYILSCAQDFPTLFNDENGLTDILNDWEAPIGSSIIESWGLAERIASAVRDYKDTSRDHDDSVDYTDILIVAYVLYQFVTASDDTEFVLNDIPASQRLNLAAADMIKVLTESENQIRSLQRALGK